VSPVTAAEWNTIVALVRENKEGKR
jgi:hypothetical protein